MHEALSLPLITGTPSLSDTTIAWSPSMLQESKSQYYKIILISTNMYLRLMTVILKCICVFVCVWEREIEKQWERQRDNAGCMWKADDNLRPLVCPAYARLAATSSRDSPTSLQEPWVQASSEDPSLRLHQLSRIFSWLFLYSVCILVYVPHAGRCLPRSEESIKFHRAGLKSSWTTQWGWWEFNLSPSFARPTSAPNYWTISPAPQSYILKRKRNFRFGKCNLSNKLYNKMCK